MDMTNTKKIILHGMKGERIEMDEPKDLNDKRALKHHNNTVNIESGAWNKKNFSNDPTKVYNDLEIEEDYGDPLYPWLHDIFKKKKK